MSNNDHIIKRINKSIPCITLIGMPGAGKTTIGKRLANRLHWAYIDSDHLIEATYGMRLQDIVNATDKEQFLEIESKILCATRVQRVVLGTGGSVVYSEEAMSHLHSFSLIVHLDVPLKIVAERIAQNPERGIAIAPGQTLEDIYLERKNLYTKWANLQCSNANVNPEECVTWIYTHLPEPFRKYINYQTR